MAILARPPGWLLKPLVGSVVVLSVMAILTAGLAPFVGEDEILNVALLYLLTTLVAAAIWGYRVGLVSAVVADLLVNFFFIPPLYGFTVQKPANILALLLYLAVASVGASMLALLRRQAMLASARQAETAVLLDLSQQSAHAVTPRDAMERLCVAITRAVGAKGCAILRKDDDWAVVASFGDSGLSRSEAGLASEALRTSQVLRFGGAVRARIPSMPQRTHERSLTFVPFHAPVPGALRIDGPIGAPPLVDAERLLTAFADEASVALHRSRLSEEARRVEALQKADEFKTALLSSVSHDLRSPLTAIKASVGSLRDTSVEWSEEDRGSFLETIESQTDRLTATVNNLLQMSRLEGGAVKPSIEAVEVKPLISEAVASASASLSGREVVVDAPGDLWLRGDYGLVLQSLVNLIENAGKYSTPGCRVFLGAERHAGRVRLTVGDEGPGMPPAELPHIFEKFYRGSASGRARGTGLGLSIVKAMVELCGGTVTVRSEPSGTIFTVDLPPASAPPR
jgi:two-component system sensor histidine kinase KdpD